MLIAQRGYHLQVAHASFARKLLSNTHNLLLFQHLLEGIGTGNRKHSHALQKMPLLRDALLGDDPTGSELWL